MEDLRRITVVVVILLCACDLPLQVLTQDPEGNEGSPVDIKLLQHPNISNLLKYPGCEEFLLKGALPSQDPGSVHGWQGGQWIAPDPVPRRWTFIRMESTFAHYPKGTTQTANFEVTQHTSKEWGGWAPESTPKKVLHYVEGQLSLGVAFTQNSQVNYTTVESVPPGGRMYCVGAPEPRLIQLLAAPGGAPPRIPGISEYQPFINPGISEGRERLVLLMQGAYVNTEADQRLCMLGCASRESFTPFEPYFHNDTTVSTEIDCKFLVKMKYPKHHTQTSRQVEAEVMSLRSEEDPLYIPPMVILGPSPTIHTYVFTKQVSSLISTDLITSSEELDSDNFSPATPQHLVNYLALFYTRKWETTWLPHSLKDSNNNVKVQKRPFTYNPNIMVDSSSKISATVSFQNILCRYEESGTSGATGALLVSALMESAVDVQVRRDVGLNYSEAYYLFDTVQQKLFSVEGKWDPFSGELCMVGCGAYSTHRVNTSTNLDDLTMLKSSKNMSAKVLSKLSSAGCNWKICVHSVLRKYVTVDSPLGAVVSSLHEAGHPDHFEPIRIRNKDSELTPTETGFPTEYRYTRSSQAIDLAEMSFNRSTVDANENAGLVFPAPPRMVDEADMMCTTYSPLVRDLDLRRQYVLQKHGRAEFELSFSHLESCAWNPDAMWRVDWSLVHQPKVRYPPKTYVKVAVRFFMSDFNEDQMRDDLISYHQRYAMWEPQVAEGVYDPHTGEMHLFATVLPGDQGLNLTLPRIGGKDAEVEDRQIYLRIQYPPKYPNIAPMQNYEVKISIESLRKVTDPLYFEPLEFQRRFHMYASEVSPMIDEAHWGDVEDGLMQTVIMLSVMRQITYGQRNAQICTPYLSTVMLGVQSLCYLIRSLTLDVFLDDQFAYSFINFHEFQIANKALSLVNALLFVVLVQQVSESRLRLQVRSRSSKTLHPPPASESKTFELFAVAFGVVFISSLLNAWMGSPPELAYNTIGDFNSNPNVRLPGLDYSQPRRYEWWGIGFEIFSNSVQHLYLLPQVIANVLCDLKVKPLSISFILGPSLVYMGSNLHQLYSGFQLLGGSAYQLGAPPLADSWAMSPAYDVSNASFVSTFVSSSRAMGFGEAVIVVGDLAITLLVCLLAVVALLQQQRGGRLGWFPCNEEADQNIIESNDDHALIVDLERLAHGLDGHPNLEGIVSEETNLPLVVKSGDLQPV